MFNKILLATDGSDLSRRATHDAIYQASGKKHRREEQYSLCLAFMGNS